ncbi:RpoE-regulated lipoprotein [Yersinia aleksiciae]|uniref:Putative outer membrane lipoprotein YfeY n=1 Tax=Yersinia aleksiciae TaxID=263819 RepID=A0A0T9TQ62_YERAE|nr:RpoE-regulated lipoprotein [Yersinia aleksiciae]AKP32632.1 RpoE-regulated lipoprotein [Yersinia aleksiciae]MDA5499408.1 RpoE-regulated lipoprotein [Yersinia aleksiciae]MDN0124098.1 RpoE-regulated lipoprotein [Yersinia aleksiciae]NIK99636.1 RpoE-regulated lipoprotein [Yersinia aleksiciae]WQC71768.1 RpoE-regulated lipoprotein [Yersinia aleksiciae]
MNIRPRLSGVRLLLLGAPLLLAGCSSMSGFSWSSLSPLNWFSGSSSLQVTDQGVGGMTASTPLAENEIKDGLKGDYRLRSGMATNDGKLVSFYQAMKEDQIKLVISGQPKGTVERIDVMDKNIPSQSGVKIGTPFSDLYQKAFGVCRQGTGEDAAQIECAAPDSKHVSYLFAGDWHGPEGLMPSDDTLKSWKVSKIIWRAKSE